MTFSELHAEVCRLANLLRRRGVGKGDVVCLYMPMTPYAVYSMLACARIGAVHSIVFAGFSAEALCQRIVNSDATTLITADEGMRGGKTTPLRLTCEEAMAGCPGQVRNVIVQQRTGSGAGAHADDIPLQAAMARERPVCPAEPMAAEDPLFLLYTSGSTGEPKGLTHTTGGYLTYTALTHKHIFDYRPGDVYACVADVGWITGHSYVVYGPLMNGAATVLFESLPTYPDAGRYWEMVERLRISQFYTAPTAIRLLIKSGDEYVKKYDRSSLRVLGTGEAASPGARPLCAVPPARPAPPPPAAYLGSRGSHPAACRPVPRSGRAHQPRSLELVPRRRRRGQGVGCGHLVANWSVHGRTDGRTAVD